MLALVWNANRIGEVLNIVVAIYLILLGLGWIPQKTKTPEEMKQWRERYGGWMILGGSVLIGIALLKIFVL